MSIEITGVDETLKAIDDQLRLKQRQATAAVRSAGMEYVRDVKKLAPVLTGQYRGSIHMKMETENGQPVALIGTDLPQAKRLEFGFWDRVDRLGRRYFQRARPHFRPALDLNRQKYIRIMKGELNSGDMLVEGEY
jgi:hypothetical protein